MAETPPVPVPASTDAAVVAPTSSSAVPVAQSKPTPSPTPPHASTPSIQSSGLATGRYPYPSAQDYTSLNAARRRSIQSTTPRPAMPIPSYGSSSSSASSSTAAQGYRPGDSYLPSRSSPLPGSGVSSLTTSAPADRPVLPGLKSHSPPVVSAAASSQNQSQSPAVPSPQASPASSAAAATTATMTPATTKAATTPPVSTPATLPSTTYRSNPMSVSSMLSGPPREHNPSAYSALPSTSTTSRPAPAQPPTLPKSNSFEAARREERERDAGPSAGGSKSTSLPGTPGSQPASKPPTPRTGSGGSPKLAGQEQQRAEPSRSSYPPLPSAFAREAPYRPLPGSGGSSAPTSTSAATSTTAQAEKEPKSNAYSSSTAPTPASQSHLPPWARSHLPASSTLSSLGQPQHPSTSTSHPPGQSDRDTQAAKAAASKTFFQHLGQFGRPPPRETVASNPTASTHHRHGSNPATSNPPPFPWSAPAPAHRDRDRERERDISYYTDRTSGAPTSSHSHSPQQNLREREREQRDRERQQSSSSLLSSRSDPYSKPSSSTTIGGSSSSTKGGFPRFPGQSSTSTDPSHSHSSHASSSQQTANGSHLHKRRRSDVGLGYETSHSSYHPSSTATSSSNPAASSSSHAPRPLKVPKVHVAPFTLKEARIEMVRPKLVSVDNEMVWKSVETKSVGVVESEKGVGAKAEEKKESVEKVNGTKEASKENGNKMDVDTPATTTPASTLPITVAPPTTTTTATPTVARPCLGRKQYDPFVDPAVLLSGSFMRNSVGGIIEVCIPVALLGGAAFEVGDPASYEGGPVPGSSSADAGGLGLEVTKEMWDLEGLRERKVWGTDVYTDDSDVLAVAIHSGWLRVAEGASKEKDKGEVETIVVRLVVAPALIRYHGCTRMGIKSRSWGNGHDGVSIMVKEVVTMKDRLPALGRRSMKVRAGLYAAELKKLAISAPAKQVTIEQDDLSAVAKTIGDTFVLEARGKGTWVDVM